MVRIPLAFSLFLSLYSGPALAEDRPEGITLATECIKKEIFVGEQVLCNFVVAGPDDVIEVEVAKFPEFRGFWSENIALRQGPIPLMAGFDPGMRKAVIGSYILIPMIGRSEPTIIPMKVVIRRPMTGENREWSVTSEIIPLKINQLPPVPNEEDKALFKGAVGTFSFLAETREVVFQKNEPVALRFSLQGEGNFQEINDLPLNFPEGVEVLSKRAYTQGSGQFYSKTFEITVVIPTDRSFELALPPFVFFNPLLKRYEKLVLSPIPFRYVPPTPRGKEVDREPLQLPPLYETWTAYRPLWKGFGFWIAQAIFAGLCLALVVTKARRQSVAKRRANRALQRRVRWDIAQNALQLGNLETFLRVADELVYEALKDCFRLRDGLTRHQALQLLEGKLDPELLSLARQLFHARDTFSYSPQKTLPQDPQVLKTALTRILDETSAKRAA